MSEIETHTSDLPGLPVAQYFADGYETENVNGYVGVKIFEEGEFSHPLYTPSEMQRYARAAIAAALATQQQPVPIGYVHELVLSWPAGSTPAAEVETRITREPRPGDGYIHPIYGRAPGATLATQQPQGVPEGWVLVRSDLLPGRQDTTSEANLIRYGIDYLQGWNDCNDHMAALLAAAPSPERQG